MEHISKKNMDLVITRWFDEYKIKVVVRSQQSFSCSKLTVETLGKGAKYVQNNNKDIYCPFIHHTFIANFEQISHLFPMFLLLTLMLVSAIFYHFFTKW